MGKAVKRGLTLLLAALLAVCALFPSVALEGESAGLENEPPEAASEGAGTEEPSENPGEVDPAEGDTPDESREPEETEDPAEEPSEEERPAENVEPAAEEPAEPEKTLEELRDELLAILGEGEEAETIRAEADRLIALGDPNGTLRSYLEGAIRLRQMQYEMQQLQAELEQLALSDESLAAMDQAAAAMENADETLERIRSEVSEAAARLMENAGYDGTGDLAAMAASALNYADGTETGRQLAAIILLDSLSGSGLLSEAGTVTAADKIRAALGRLTALTPGMTESERVRLERASQAIAGVSNLAEPMSPGWLVSADRRLTLTEPVFTYNGAIMLSIGDAAAFAGGRVVDMEDNDAVVIQGSGIVLEMIKGSSDAYLNDKLKKMPAPALVFDGVCYVPLDTVLESCGLARMTIDNIQLIYPVK